MAGVIRTPPPIGIVAPGWAAILTALRRFLQELEAHEERPELWFTRERARALQAWLNAAEVELHRGPASDPRQRYRELLQEVYPALQRLQARLLGVASRLEDERRHAEAVRAWCERLPPALPSAVSPAPPSSARR